MISKCFIFHAPYIFHCFSLFIFYKFIISHWVEVSLFGFDTFSHPHLLSTCIFVKVNCYILNNSLRLYNNWYFPWKFGVGSKRVHKLSIYLSIKLIWMSSMIRKFYENNIRETLYFPILAVGNRSIKRFWVSTDSIVRFSISQGFFFVKIMFHVEIFLPYNYILMLLLMTIH